MEKRVRLRSRGREHLTGPASTGVVCNAPFASMYLDQRGIVRACCQNVSHPLGMITESSLSEIWQGANAQELRRAISAEDMSLGCNFCAWTGDGDAGAGTFARTFDHLGSISEPSAWPRQLELSLSNSCNLQCVMCNGEWSSSIRSIREGRPPIPKVYTDAFFEDLASVLPHVEVVKLLGGEPFLSSESIRVMELIRELAPAIEIHVTTNGTQWSSRLERLLDGLRVHIVVSLDGATEATYESIRVGASWVRVMANIDRLSDYCRRAGTSFSLSHCLLLQNWHEFDEFLRLAEQMGSSVFVNTVTEPRELSLYHLPPRELRAVVNDLAHRDASVRSVLTGSRAAAWSQQLRRLSDHLERLQAFRLPSFVAARGSLGFAWLAPPDGASLAGDRLASALEFADAWLIDLAQDGTVIRSAAHGSPSAELASAVHAAARIGAKPDGPLDPEVGQIHRADRHDLRSRRGELVGEDASVEVMITWIAIRDEDGVITGARIAIEQYRAFHAASALADGSDRLAGFVATPNGALEVIDGDIHAVLGLESTEAISTVADLTSAVDEALGAVSGPDPGWDASGGELVRRYVGSEGAVRSLHLFGEPTGSSFRTWVVRVDDPPGLVPGERDGGRSPRP